MTVFNVALKSSLTPLKFCSTLVSKQISCLCYIYDQSKDEMYNPRKCIKCLLLNNKASLTIADLFIFLANLFWLVRYTHLFGIIWAGLDR